jgi:hypothetical protein
MGRNLALAVLLAVALSCTGSADTPTSGRDRWFEVASATGSIPAGAPATTECRWDLPCDLVRTDAFETGSGPIRLVCEGDATYLFVEYHPGPEPSSGNTHVCSGDMPSAIFLVPEAETGFYLYGVSRAQQNVPLEWTVSVQVWHGRWVEPDCANRSTRRPRGAWETCGEGPTGFALPAPTPSVS